MGDEVTTTAVMLATMDGKLNQINDKLASIALMGQDHEQRIRELEARSYVTPTSMWMGIGAVAAVVGALSPFLVQLYGG